MSNLSFDYSKWDNIDLSDDETDFHPNLDTGLNIKVKRAQRERKMDEYEKQRKELLADGSPAAMDKLRKLEKSKPLFGEDLCHVVDEKTIISDKKIEHAPPPVTKDEASSSGEDTLDYMEKNEDVLEQYAEITDLDELEQFLYDHPVLLHEYGCMTILIFAKRLECAHEREASLNCCRNYLVLRNIMDLAGEAHQLKESRPMVQMFFKQIKENPDRKKKLDEETVNFHKQILDLIAKDAFNEPEVAGAERPPKTD
ncbi:hsp90 co-chaperone Cdc37 [Perkinsus chesapeaki]|uniref:Hsp90 co-chaperone Cdc37 n=1 Tax=Perkinsus chesapeaki TaxID=330153 RepID=A0A7J6L4Q5_PERCH|nr:hsp90 co-chaperone Cdc37 [Perkinsus chesapeaki]